MVFDPGTGLLLQSEERADDPAQWGAGRGRRVPSSRAVWCSQGGAWRPRPRRRRAQAWADRASDLSD